MTRTAPEPFSGSGSVSDPADSRAVNSRRASSVGLGTYLGSSDETTDHHYREAIRTALQSDCNILDTAINYRHQQSERNIGIVVEAMVEAGTITREDIHISTKGGFLAAQGEFSSAPARYFYEEYLKTGLCKAYDLVAGCHCMTPAYLEDQLDRSLKNLRLSFIDTYYIHNPEIQLTEIARPEFLRRMQAAFELLERKVEEGKIGVYGTATWEGYRLLPGAPAYLSIAELNEAATRIAGANHHFRAVQLPYNFAMPEAFLLRNQRVGSRDLTMLEACEHLGIAVQASATLLQGRLTRNLPDSIRKLFSGTRTDAQRAIQFVRSTPGVTTALVGMANLDHVRENLQVMKLPPMPPDEMRAIFRK